MDTKPKMLMIDGSDEILKHWQVGTDAVVIDRDRPWSAAVPVVRVLFVFPLSFSCSCTL